MSNNSDNYMWARRFRNANARMAKQKDDSSWCVGFEYEFADPASRDYECPLLPSRHEGTDGHRLLRRSLLLQLYPHSIREWERVSAVPETHLQDPNQQGRGAENRRSPHMLPHEGSRLSWQGPARDAAAHLARETGDCGFVPVDCPAKCGQEALRSHIPVHLRDHCPKREVVCPHCRHGAPADQMLAEHWMACPMAARGRTLRSVSSGAASNST